MLRLSLCTIALYGVLGALGSRTLAGSVKGTLHLPRGFRPQVDAVGLPVLWQLPNPYVPLGPPLVDPRRFMVVALEGPAAEGEVPLRTTSFQLVHSRAEPPVLAVEPRTKVVFQNRDPILHIIEPAPGEPEFMKPRSVAPGDEFGHVFTKVGTFRLRCSEVPHLRATVLVTEQPRIALPDQDGTFEFVDLQQDEFRLRIWYAGKWIHDQPVQVRGKTTVDVNLPAISGR